MSRHLECLPLGQVAVYRSTMRTRSTPVVLDRVEHDNTPVKLTHGEKVILDEALRRGEDLREVIESKTLEYGRWLLEKVFANDTTEALDDKSHNPIWQELLRRSGGPTLAINRRFLYVALRIAAADRRISAQAWRGLDAGRKELLLPLHDDKRLLAGARHVSDLNLSHRKTREYVSGILATGGSPRRARVTPRGFVKRVKQMRGSLGGKDAVHQLRAVRHEMNPDDRETATTELRALQEVVTKLLAVLRRG